MEKMKLTKEELDYPEITDEQRRNYAYGILETEDYAYGQIIREAPKSFRMIPYNVYGNITILLKEPEIGLDPDKKLKKDDYIRGRLTIRRNKENAWYYYLIDVERLDSEEEFTNKLTEKLKKKWDI